MQVGNAIRRAPPARPVEPEAEPKFDLQVTIYDKMGNIVGKNPYRTFFIGDEKYFERPKFSRNLYYENGEWAGRLIEANEEHTDKKTGRKKTYTVPAVDTSAEFVEYEAPLTEDQMIAKEISETRAQNVELDNELRAMRAENEALLAKLKAQDERKTQAPKVEQKASAPSLAAAVAGAKPVAPKE